MIEVSLTYINENDMKRIDVDKFPSVLFRFIDVDTSKGKKEGYALKGHWAARKDPFAVVVMDGTPTKAFYSEADNDVVQSLINYLNGL